MRDRTFTVSPHVRRRMHMIARCPSATMSSIVWSAGGGKNYRHVLTNYVCSHSVRYAFRPPPPINYEFARLIGCELWIITNTRWTGRSSMFELVYNASLSYNKFVPISSRIQPNSKSFHSQSAYQLVTTKWNRNTIIFINTGGSGTIFTYHIA